MGEIKLRNIFIFGTLFFLLVLIWMTYDSLTEVISGRAPQMSEAVIAGKQTWQDKNCNDCHTILGIGGYFAPEMTKVVERRDASWLVSFMTGPQTAKPGTTMPNQFLTAAQANQLLAFFQWVSQIDTNNWPPPAKMALGGATTTSGSDQVDIAGEGERIFFQKGCDVCHMINGRGAIAPGPDLSRIGSQPYDDLPNSADFLYSWLTNPQEAKPGTTMPRIELSEAEKQALVAYLTSLK